MLGYRLENLFNEPTAEFSTNVSMREESRALRCWSLDLVHHMLWRGRLDIQGRTTRQQASEITALTDNKGSTSMQIRERVSQSEL
jgi:hypothetical protein